MIWGASLVVVLLASRNIADSTAPSEPIAPLEPVELPPAEDEYPLAA